LAWSWNWKSKFGEVDANNHLKSFAMDGNSSFSDRRIALLAGGDSPERDVSIASGREVTLALTNTGYDPTIIDPAACDLACIDWSSFDICFLALHGGAGEDGRIQTRLEQWDIPYTGSDPAASKLAMSKAAAKRQFEAWGVPTPSYILLSSTEIEAVAAQPGVLNNPLLRQLQPLGFPIICKPESQGSSLGVNIAHKPEEIFRHLATAAQFDNSVLVEPLVTGREFTISLLGREPLPMIEIVAPRKLFTYEAKYSDPQTEYRLDVNLPGHIEAHLYRTAIAAAAALGTAGLVRVDLMLDQNNCPWVLEVNTIPGMTKRSLSPRAARAAGIEMPALVDWMLRDAINRHPSTKHKLKKTFSAEPL
jgi:D-alanine-D-alanine ligase